MRHARPDYNGRIVDLQGRIPANEPVFLLRAQDVLAPNLVRLWAEQYSREPGADPRMIAMAHEQAQAMTAWQRRHEPKTPDLPTELIETKTDDLPVGRTVYGE